MMKTMLKGMVRPRTKGMFTLDEADEVEALKPLPTNEAPVKEKPEYPPLATKLLAAKVSVEGAL
jgi:hypothetical protein